MKSLLLSLIIHLAVFNTFVFVFPVNPASYKPQLTFLGSILPTQDIVNATKGKGLSPSDFHPKAFKNKNVDFTNHPFIHDGQRKSAFNGPNLSDENKLLIKSTFLPPKKETRPLDVQELKDLGINLELEPYRPLRFQTR